MGTFNPVVWATTRVWTREVLTVQVLATEVIPATFGVTLVETLVTSSLRTKLIATGREASRDTVLIPTTVSTRARNVAVVRRVPSISMVP